MSHDGAGSRYGIGKWMPLVAKGSESGRSPVCVHVFGVTMSNPRNTRDAYSTPANAPVAVRYARTPARAEFELITHDSSPQGPQRLACNYRGCFSTRHTPFRRRSVCSSCSPRVGHGGHGQVVACLGAPYAVWGPVNVVWLERGVCPDP